MSNEEKTCRYYLRAGKLLAFCDGREVAPQTGPPPYLITCEVCNPKAVTAPIPMRLPCEGCGELHVDEGEFATKPHHTHACQFCGAVWRPAIVHTIGVRFLPGFKNMPMRDAPDEVAAVRKEILEHVRSCDKCRYLFADRVGAIDLDCPVGQPLWERFSAAIDAAQNANTIVKP